MINTIGWINTIYRKQLRREKRRNNKARVMYKSVSTQALEAFADQMEIWTRRAKWLLFAVIVVLGLIGLFLFNIAIIVTALALMVILSVVLIALELDFFPEPLYLVELDRREAEARDKANARSSSESH